MKRVMSLVLVSVLSMAALSASAAVRCYSTDGGAKGNWYGQGANPEIAKARAIAACQNAARTLDKGSCRITTCIPD